MSETASPATKLEEVNTNVEKKKRRIPVLQEMNRLQKTAKRKR